MLVVSACLLGLNTKYNGGNNRREDVLALEESCLLIPICPEQLGGLPTPREPAEIQGGDGHDVLAGRASVKAKTGKDCTAAFVCGAKQALEVARLVGAQLALLKARSPSCGSNCIYDGQFRGKTIAGDGVTAARFKQAGIAVFTEETLAELRLLLTQRGS
ncbi:MAG: DUF523 domain-containing protein [Firmicutes bacterium]|nr:DUF523 domain-containing protein [Bacillota bacterium]